MSGSWKLQLVTELKTEPTSAANMVPIICKMTQAVEIKVKMPICGKEIPVMNMAVYLWQLNGVLGWLTCTCYQSNYCRYYRGYLRRVSLSSLSLGSVTFSYWFRTMRPHSFPEITATALIQVNTVCSGRASFQGDAYTVHKWTRNLEMRTKENRYRNEWCTSKAPLPLGSSNDSAK